MIKFQQSQALTSHLESFWSIVWGGGSQKKGQILILQNVKVATRFGLGILHFPHFLKKVKNLQAFVSTFIVTLSLISFGFTKFNLSQHSNQKLVNVMVDPWGGFNVFHSVFHGQCFAICKQNVSTLRN